MAMASGFDVLPAIDLRGGRVVRLRQGDFGQETSFDDDPVVVAERFAAAGARWLHVVDLDGARTGTPAHASVDRRDRRRGRGPSRRRGRGRAPRRAGVEAALTGGAARAVIGTAALADPDLAGRLVRAWGAERIAVAIDVRDGRAVGHGWAASDPGSMPWMRSSASPRPVSRPSR